MKILVDMNLSPEWVPVLAAAGFEAVHWQSLGSPAAPDEELFAWAEQNHLVLCTQDLDFSQLLFRTRAGSPSVVLVRLQNELDGERQARVCRLMQSVAADLDSGGLLVIDERRARLRRLPIIADEDNNETPQN